MAKETDRVTVRLTQQQLQLLEKLRAEGEFGSDYSEILVRVFRKYAEEFLGKGRFGHVGRP